MSDVYRSQTVFATVMFSQVSVILSTGGGRSASREGSASRGYASRRGLHPGGSASGRGAGRPIIRYYGIWSTSGWYASYWNAFLFYFGISYVSQLSTFRKNSNVQWLEIGHRAKCTEFFGDHLLLNSYPFLSPTQQMYFTVFTKFSESWQNPKMVWLPGLLHIWQEIRYQK